MEHSMKYSLAFLNFLEDDCQKKINAIIVKRDIAIKKELDDYRRENALYKIGDILKPKRLHKYFMVEKVEASISYGFLPNDENHLGEYVLITYYGKGYKKVGNEFVRTADDRVRRLCEEQAVLIKKA